MASLPLGLPSPDSGVMDFDIHDQTPFSVYVHIPFCTVRCGYCDFNTYTSTELRGVTRQSFVEDLISEIRFSQQVFDTADVPYRTAQSVFFGGGTPSLLDPADVARIISAITETHGLAAGCEITLETNPDTVDLPKLAAFRDAGVTRISVGMQSAVPRILGLLDRTHDPDRVSEVVSAAQNLGLSTSVDVIYGTPTETEAEWQLTLDAAVALNPDHISAYSLIVEDGTAMARQISRGELPPIDDDIHATMYEMCDRAVAEAGYEWYEVSNWSRPGHESVHNRAYWNSFDWWGYGPGAHSHMGGVRWWNAKHPAAYAERLARGITPGIGHEKLSPEDQEFERVLLQIRVRTGVAIDSLRNLRNGVVAGLIARELVDAHAALKGTLVLTRNGRLLADAVARELTS